MSEAPMLMVGLMSGTSLDGMDAALVRVQAPGEISLLAFVHRPYAPAERRQIEAVLAGGPIAEVARLHAALGDWAGEAVDVLLNEGHIRADHLSGIAFPGQTIWHEPPVVTWQLGDASRLAERFGVRVIHDFRARDVAAGGQGAPLVPLVDALCFAGHDMPRILLNVGGMANATWVAARGNPDEAVAGDSGPGMAVIDALARLIDPSRSCDRDGVLARQGVVRNDVLEELLTLPFFSQAPPRSTGREQFGVDYAAELLRRLPGPDSVRTAVELTATSVHHFCRRWLPTAGDVVVSGGGRHHPVLMERLAARFDEDGVRVRRFDDLFFDGDAKEAAAFALLGWLTLHGQPGNLPRVTGAGGPRVLGSVAPA